MYFDYSRNSVKVVYPLKQGLKQEEREIDPQRLGKVKVVYPLKQGLKLTAFLLEVRLIGFG